MVEPIDERIAQAREVIVLPEVSEDTCICIEAISASLARGHLRYRPSQQFIEHFRILLHLANLHRFRSVDDAEWWVGAIFFEIRATWLKEATCEEDFEERIGVLDEVELGTSED